MKTYKFLSSLPFLVSYSSKFLFIAFIGTHIPLIGVIFYLSLNPTFAFSFLTVVILVLSFTLLSVMFTLLLLRDLTTPIRKAAQALHQYLREGMLPDLPTEYHDETGVMMKNLQFSLLSMDEMLTDRQDVIARLSHDLRGPIASIQNLCELGRSTDDTETHQNYLGLIEGLAKEQIATMEKMLSNLRASAHLPISNPKGFHKEQLLLAPFVEEILKNFTSALKEKDLSIHTTIPEHLEIKVEPSSFRMVLINLIENAIKFSHAGGNIYLQAIETEQLVRMWVKDEGLGFAPEDSQLIFQKFTRKGQRGTRNEKSNGVGLYLSKQTIQEHGGEIHAMSSGKDQGATFEVKLPKSDCSEPSADH